MRNEFYKDTQGALLVYDVSDRQSFEALELWLNEMRQEIGNQVEVDNVVFAVCANKVRHHLHRLCQQGTPSSSSSSSPLAKYVFISYSSM